MTTFGRDAGSPYMLAGMTGTMAATPLAINSVVFAMRASPQPAATLPQTKAPLQIDGVYLAFTTIVAFTTAVLAGRQLGLYKGTVALPGAGTAIAPVVKRTSDAGSDNGLDTANAQIATTTGLTQGAFVRGGRIGLLDLTAFGAAGARVEKYYPFLDSEAAPIILDPGELLIVGNEVAFDAAGTWQLEVEVAYRRRGD